MEFKDSFFMDEVRDGYYISSLMKRSWAANIELLSRIDKVCKKNGIKYFADWGTILGVVRHAGFVPWDDDLDICMMGDDYKKFSRVLKESDTGLTLVDYHSSEDTDNMVAHVTGQETVLSNVKEIKEFHGYPYGVSIDIFRMDYLPSDEKEMKDYFNILSDLADMVGVLNEKREGVSTISDEEIANALLKIEKFSGIQFDKTKSIKHQIYDLMRDKLGSKYKKNDAKEVTDLPNWSQNYDFRFPKSCYENTVNLPFENTTIEVAIGYEELLYGRYGRYGYMKPVRQGGSHGYPIYDELQELIKKVIGSDRKRYIFSGEEIEEIEKLRKTKKDMSVTSQIIGFVSLFREAHKELYRLAIDGKMDEFVNVLGDCQNVAIEIGNTIEEKLCKNTETVSKLENYCELLYLVSQGEKQIDDELFSELEGFVDTFENQIEHEFMNKKKIVFIPFSSEHWNVFDKVYRMLDSDENNDVSVIPAPYFYKDEYSEEKKDAMVYDLDYPEDVNVVSYEKYNFEANHPDEIYIQCPFDEYNWGFSLHPFFYSTNIKQYCDKLIFIPYLLMGEVGKKDDRFLKMLMEFVNMPGVVHADEIYAQSAKMVDVYVKLLTEFSGKEYEKSWEKKVRDIHTLCPEWNEVWKPNKLECTIPETWRKFFKENNAKDKRIVTFYVSASSIASKGKAMLKKIEDVLEKMRRRDDLIVIFRPDVNIRKIFRKEKPEIWREYSRIVEKFKADNYGIFDDTNNENTSVYVSDAIYGSGGSLLYKAKIQKKQVMVLEI